MTLYELAPTPSARRVNIFLAELGVSVDRVNVDIRGGENLTDEFKAMSINGRIPVLKLDDGQTLCESVAICRYFDELLKPVNSLFGNSPIEKANVEMWQRICELQGLFVGFQAFRNITKIYEDRENCIEAWGEESKLRLIDFLPTLETQLSQHEYIAGNTFSIADITAYVMVSFIQHLDITPTPVQLHLQRWQQQIEQRVAVQSVNAGTNT
ncbi:glutathione S-transferase [Shewanella hanedai]|uniref:Glutathione S-transferase n=1 Tax=Shewanella hanedai TaxID=25 RepID=A0A553JLH6_SHEHA|nr:glutathione S-transferase [Shewanella hanedai]TRY13309.1 glutathione S-transferase [Shewanella hanedai]GGJ00843.1 glutathione S-transferase [Shewanella hanedai]